MVPYIKWLILNYSVCQARLWERAFLAQSVSFQAWRGAHMLHYLAQKTLGFIAFMYVYTHDPGRFHDIVHSDAHEIGVDGGFWGVVLGRK